MILAIFMFFGSLCVIAGIIGAVLTFVGQLEYPELALIGFGALLLTLGLILKVLGV